MEGSVLKKKLSKWLLLYIVSFWNYPLCVLIPTTKRFLIWNAIQSAITTANFNMIRNKGGKKCKNKQLLHKILKLNTIFLVGYVLLSIVMKLLMELCVCIVWMLLRMNNTWQECYTSYLGKIQSQSAKHVCILT